MKKYISYIRVSSSNQLQNKEDLTPIGQESAVAKFIDNILASTREYERNIMSERIKTGIKNAKLKRNEKIKS